MRPRQSRPGTVTTNLPCWTTRDRHRSGGPSGTSSRPQDRANWGTLSRSTANRVRAAQPRAPWRARADPTCCGCPRAMVIAGSAARTRRSGSARRRDAKTAEFLRSPTQDSRRIDRNFSPASGLRLRRNLAGALGPSSFTRVVHRPSPPRARTTIRKPIKKPENPRFRRHNVLGASCGDLRL